MKKGIVLLVITLIISFLWPSYVLLETVNRTPNPMWSNAITLQTIADSTYKKSFPLTILAESSAEVAVFYVSEGRLHIERFDAFGQPLYSADFTIPTDTVWLFAAERQTDQSVAIYLESADDVYYATYDPLKGQISSYQLIGSEIKQFSVSGDYALLYSENQAFLYRKGRAIETLDLQNIKSLQIGESEDALLIAYNQKLNNAFSGYLLKYDKKSATVNQPFQLFDDLASDDYGNVSDMAINGDTVAIVYSKTVVDNGAVIGVHAAIVTDGQSIQSQRRYRDKRLQTTIVIDQITQDDLSVISLNASPRGVDYFKWDFFSGFDNALQLTDTPQASIEPTLVRTELGQYFYWLDLSSRGKSLRMASDRAELIKISKRVELMDLLQIPAVLLMSGLLPYAITFIIPVTIPLLIIFLIYLFVADRSKNNAQAQRRLFYLFTCHSTLYLCAIYYFVIKASLQNLTISAMPVDWPLLGTLLLLAIFAAAFVISALLYDSAEHDWYFKRLATYMLVSTLLLTINYNLYTVIDMMKRLNRI